ncbi:MULTISPECIES: hypothetical protein [Rhodococcus]|uniref:hypothetical protein n=1 Tax=Rhodococcus TaxID=1827 RepID=UPI00093412AC|nr:MULTISPECIES: hypothetical protein [Rhodococcus]NCL77151.1 hypothetical protein [Rhodococcus sp. YH1]OOL32074.1 hypothetical protein GQ85_09705 [Rhodococcus rhodochrous]MBP2214780.1 hypothetical protein [Rhodococcus ruber]NCL78843.1 hypothetical protein [Rhodococcus sp. YH1]WML60882.1 hypothetical protein QNA09_00560 [Rhodococcus sp. AH-ZY2]
MAGVNADPSSLRTLRADIDRTQREIKQAIARTRGALRSAQWKDSMKDQFERELESTLRTLDAFDRNADQLKAHLDRKARELDQYLGR